MVQLNSFNIKFCTKKFAFAFMWIIKFWAPNPFSASHSTFFFFFLADVWIIQLLDVSNVCLYYTYVNLLEIVLLSIVTLVMYIIYETLDRTDCETKYFTIHWTILVTRRLVSYHTFSWKVTSHLFWIWLSVGWHPNYSDLLCVMYACPKHWKPPSTCCPCRQCSILAYKI